MYKYLKKQYVIILALSSLSCFANLDNNYALIIIDMQQDFIERGNNHKTAENKIKVQNIIETQLTMIVLAKENKIPIIFIKYEGFGSVNEKLREAAANYKEVKYFLKSENDMFSEDNTYRSELFKYLTNKGIKHLIIAGANGSKCIQSSINGSLTNNYNVIALSTAIADFKYANFIYPYKNKYNFYNPQCDNCKFIEINNTETLTTYLKSNFNEQINDSPRKIGTVTPINNSNRKQRDTVFSAK